MSLHLREVSPEWDALNKKQNELFHEEEALLAECRVFAETLPRDGSAPFGARARLAPPPQLTKDARELLGDLAPAENMPADQPMHRWDSLEHQRAAEVSHRLAAVREARAAADEKMRTVQRDASLAYAQRRMPEHDRIAERMCNALVALGDAWLDYEAFRADVKANSADFEWFFPLDTGLFVESLGDPLERYSGWRRFLDWAIENGHWTQKALPDNWVARRHCVDPQPPAPSRRRKAGPTPQPQQVQSEAFEPPPERAPAPELPKSNPLFRLFRPAPGSDAYRE